MQKRFHFMMLTPKFKRRLIKFRFLKSKLFLLSISFMSILVTITYWTGINDEFEPHLITFVMGIMTASGALLAIGLTVLQMLVSDISRSYNPEVQKLVLGKKRADWPFYLFIITIVLSSMVIVVPDEWTEKFVLITTTIFQTALIVFTVVIFDIAKVRNPLNNIDFLYETIMENIQEDANKE